MDNMNQTDAEKQAAAEGEARMRAFATGIGRRCNEAGVDMGVLAKEAHAIGLVPSDDVDHLAPAALDNMIAFGERAEQAQG